MRLILDSHPKIEFFDEGRAYKTFDNDGPYSSIKPITGLKMPVLTELFSEYKCIQEKYKNDPIIFMKRGVLSTVASMLRMGPKWLKTETADKVDCWVTDKSRKFSEIYGESYKNLKNVKYPELAKATLFWLYKTCTYDELVKLGYPVIAVEYDNLVGKPKNEIQRVIDFLGLEWDDVLLNHHQLQHGDVNKKGFAIGGTFAARAIDKDSLYKWDKVFTQDQQKEIISICVPFWEKKNGSV